jgi:hypothetical protein
MQLLHTWLLMGMFCRGSALADAQLQLLPGQEPQALFAGGARKITVLWHNAGDETASADMHLRLYQASSATAVLLTESSWKELKVLPGQTVLEDAQIDFPAVNAETKFLVHWLEGTNLVIGKTEVMVYPTNLLHELESLLGEENLGALDPNGELKPLLRQNGVQTLDLEEMPLEDFRGKLAVIGPFQSRTQVREGLAQAIQKIARKGVAVVWIQPPLATKDQIKPSFYVVPEGKGAVVVVQPDLVADLAENPQSQLNLIYFCRLALTPLPFPLPDLKTQP